MNYQEAIAWLASLETLGIKLALRNITSVLDELGSPQRRFASILVAGSNGKGSVAAMIEAILRSAGHRTGLYTSPHLLRHEERIQIGGRPVTEETFARGLTRVKEASESLARSGRLEAHPTHFEALTAAAFDLLARSGVEVAVLEVGMGGRLDATVLSEPRLAVLTNVSLEHTQWLGDTIPAIAREKAGVLLRGGTLLAGETDPAAVEVFRARATDVGGRYIALDDYARILPATSAEAREERDRAAGRGRGSLESSLDTGARGSGSGSERMRSSPSDGSRDALPARREERSGPQGEPPSVEDGDLFDLRTGHRLHRGLRTGLRGAYQQRNALLAVAAADLLDRMGMAVPASSVAEGLATAWWPGRFQVVEGAPCFIFDGAHNPAACRALGEALTAARDAGTTIPARDRTTLLFGVLRDKDSRAMAREIASLAGRIVVTRGASSRFRDPWALAEDLRAEGIEALAAEALEEGLRLAKEITPPGGMVLVTGSLYLVGDAMGRLGIEPWPAPARSGGTRR